MREVVRGDKHNLRKSENCKAQNQYNMRSEWHWFVRCDLQIFSGCVCHLEQLHAQSPFLFPIVFSINFSTSVFSCLAFRLAAWSEKDIREPVCPPQVFRFSFPFKSAFVQTTIRRKPSPLLPSSKTRHSCQQCRLFTYTFSCWTRFFLPKWITHDPGKFMRPYRILY